MAWLEWADRRQVRLYLAALAVGALVGVMVPGLARPAEWAITPSLALLLWVTFLGVPLARVGQAVRDWRFLVTVLGLNFVVVPAVVWLLSRLVAHDRAVLVGVLFVLLTPCVDYVLVFTGLAGGAQDKLLAATPLLMAAQLVLLPLFLWWFVGDQVLGAIDWTPFVRAFLWLIVAPLVAAWLTQWAGTRFTWLARLQQVATDTMVPLMMITLALVVASQIAAVGGAWRSVLWAVPVFVLFVVVMVPLGAVAGRLAGLDVPSRRAVLFSGVTRNSLVVLPLVLALPAGFALSPLVVVTQTLVELLAMVVLVRLVPRLISSSSPSPRTLRPGSG